MLHLWMEQAHIPSYAALARQAGVGMGTIQRLRNHEAQQIPPVKLQRLAEVLGCSPLALLQACSPLRWEESNLKAEYQRLQQQLAQQPQQLRHEFQYQTYLQLETLLTQYPTARYLAEHNPQWNAKNATALFVSLQNLLARWEITAIGTVGTQVPYDPQLHQSSEPLAPGELVYIRFVGYRTAERLLQRAKVSVKPFTF